MEVSSRKFTIMEEMIIQVALTVDINTDKRQNVYLLRDYCSIRFISLLNSYVL